MKIDTTAVATLLFIAATIGVFAYAQIRDSKESAACEAKGGVLVSGTRELQCVKSVDD